VGAASAADADDEGAAVARMDDAPAAAAPPSGTRIAASLLLHAAADDGKKQLQHAAMFVFWGGSVPVSERAPCAKAAKATAALALVVSSRAWCAAELGRLVLVTLASCRV
jgi:hypothetical protein